MCQSIYRQFFNHQFNWRGLRVGQVSTRGKGCNMPGKIANGAHALKSEWV